jgi:hypothetical protein
MEIIEEIIFFKKKVEKGLIPGRKGVLSLLAAREGTEGCSPKEIEPLKPFLVPLRGGWRQAAIGDDHRLLRGPQKKA